MFIRGAFLHVHEGINQYWPWSHDGFISLQGSTSLSRI